MIKRVLTTFAATAAFAGALVSPAAASPEDGQGCVGAPDIPGAYVCVVSLTPTNALPTVTTTTVPVTVPRLCYFAGCTDPRTVQVPVPGYTEGSGYVAVLYWNGGYYTIAMYDVGFDQPPCDEINQVLWRIEIRLGCRVLDVIDPGLVDLP